MEDTGTAPPRRYEALAYLLERLSRGEGCPSYGEIGLRLGVGGTRVKQFVRQLLAEEIVGRVPGSKRGLFIRDVTRARAICVDTLHQRGASVAQPLGPFMGACPNGQLPVLPPFEHIPDVD